MIFSLGVCFASFVSRSFRVTLAPGWQRLFFFVLKDELSLSRSLLSHDRCQIVAKNFLSPIVTEGQGTPCRKSSRNRP